MTWYSPPDNSAKDAALTITPGDWRVFGGVRPMSALRPGSTSYCLNELFPHGVTNDFCNRTQVEFAHPRSAMRFDGSDGYAEHLRDFPAAPALRDQPHDFTLTGGEVGSIVAGARQFFSYGA